MKERGPNPYVPQAMKDLSLAELTERAKTPRSSDPLLGSGPTAEELLSRSLL